MTLASSGEKERNRGGTKRINEENETDEDLLRADRFLFLSKDSSVFDKLLRRFLTCCIEWRMSEMCECVDKSRVGTFPFFSFVAH